MKMQGIHLKRQAANRSSPRARNAAALLSSRGPRGDSWTRHAQTLRFPRQRPSSSEAAQGLGTLARPGHGRAAAMGESPALAPDEEQCYR
jgi:hypothetical protein